MKKMEILNVREYGTGKETKTLKDVWGESLTLEEGQMLYFVNPFFSKPNTGFIMTAEGRVWTTTMDYAPPTDEQILKGWRIAVEKLAVQAVQIIKDGKLGDLNLKFTFP